MRPAYRFSLSAIGAAYTSVLLTGLLIAEMFGRAARTIYVISNHDADVLGWSSRHALAVAAYQAGDNILPIVAGEELHDFMRRRYAFRTSWGLPLQPDSRVVAARSMPSTLRTFI